MVEVEVIVDMRTCFFKVGGCFGGGSRVVRWGLVPHTSLIPFSYQGALQSSIRPRFLGCGNVQAVFLLPRGPTMKDLGHKMNGSLLKLSTDHCLFSTRNAD